MRILFVLLPVLLGLRAGPSAASGIPSPSTSDVDPCFVVCPAGDSIFRVIPRRLDFTPLEGCSTEVRLCGCPSVHLAPPGLEASYRIYDGCKVTTTTGPAGIADLQVKAGGVCDGGAIEICGNQVLLATRFSVASFDQNGDLVVDGVDVGLAMAKRGRTDPTADFDCDGRVSDADVAIAGAHVGHRADLGIPTRGFSWGEVKIVYR